MELDLRPVQECVEFYKNTMGTEKELIATWKRQPGAPKIYRPKRGVHLVDWPEFLDYVEDIALPTAEQKRQRRGVIRRAGEPTGVRRQRVRLLRGRRDISESC